jgi:hypothetical protein
MNIDFNGPVGFIFDVSSLTDTLDRDNELSPLAWQYVIESQLVDEANLTLVSRAPHCPSLEKQYALIQRLQKRYELNFLCQLDEHILSHLRGYVLTIEMTKDVLIIIKIPSLIGVSTCS